MLTSKPIDKLDCCCDFKGSLVSQPTKNLDIFLPVEIIELIIDKLNQDDVMSMALTCRLVYKYCREKLLRRIYVDSSTRWLYRYRVPKNDISTIEPSITELRFYRNYTCIPYESFFKLLKTNNVKQVKQIIFKNPNFRLDFLTKLKIRLNHCEIIIIGNHDGLRGDVNNGDNKTLQINRISQLNNVGMNDSHQIDNLEVDGHYFRGHPEINLTQGKFKRVCIKNNTHVKFNNLSASPIEIESLIIEGIFNLSLSLIINQTKIKSLHLHFQLINFEKFNNLTILSLDIMSPKNFNFNLLENSLNSINENQLEFLRLNFITYQHIPNLLNLLDHQRQSLVQLVIQYGHFDPLWYEITAVEYGVDNPNWNEDDFQEMFNHFDCDFEKLCYVTLFNNHYHIMRSSSSEGSNESSNERRELLE